jgi:hypothetical protein
MRRRAPVFRQTGATAWPPRRKRSPQSRDRRQPPRARRGRWPAARATFLNGGGREDLQRVLKKLQKLLGGELIVPPAQKLYFPGWPGRRTGWGEGQSVQRWAVPWVPPLEAALRHWFEARRWALLLRSPAHWLRPPPQHLALALTRRSSCHHRADPDQQQQPRLTPCTAGTACSDGHRRISPPTYGTTQPCGASRSQTQGSPRRGAW